ncbi:DNA polymerase III subunit gamma tau [Chlorella sorokiniana]|uniref:DNA polymerase III subunit gamma tau n=1 Tax=Chlorella sorokiniana TaxID=3076 RepID=A0A2P6TL83_CHLSO|nr:DNA polymerase III subunit gamma tau [Chlorella sorokiniana]|eukprot:PRW45050.1 DNA polymerase III subunit gamma tau [Chlorella sorokiniana]
MASADPAPRLWRRLSSAGAAARTCARPAAALEAKGSVGLAGPSLTSSIKLAAAAAQPTPDEAADSQPLIKAAYPGDAGTKPAHQAPSSSTAAINSPRGAPAELPQLQPRRPPPPPPAAHSRQQQAAPAVQPFQFERLG